MVKDDNDLLIEWLAYHYTMLPLGFVVIGSDLGNSQDPNAVLRRWNAMNITTWTLQPEEFINRHGNYNEQYGAQKDFNNDEERTKHHHHALIHRQKGFITTCAELLKAQGVGWTLLIDTDEFLVLNPMTSEEEAKLSAGRTVDPLIVSNRKFLNSAIEQKESFTNVLRSLKKVDENNIGTCYTIPRLLVGALENETCPGVEATRNLAKSIVSNGLVEHLSTLRFFQHARKGDFSFSKFGKVLIDLSSLDDKTVGHQVPANIHRPFRQYCRSAGGIDFAKSYFYILHYIGSWERYASRTDYRRNKSEWEARSYVHADKSACATVINRWIQMFIQHVGEKVAGDLLSLTPNVARQLGR